MAYVVHGIDGLNRARTAQLGRRWGCRLSVGQCFECWCRRIAAIAISYQKQQQPAAQVKLHCTARASQLNNSNPPQGPVRPQPRAVRVTTTNREDGKTTRRHAWSGQTQTQPQQRRSRPALHYGNTYESRLMVVDRLFLFQWQGIQHQATADVVPSSFIYLPCASGTFLLVGRYQSPVLRSLDRQNERRRQSERRIEQSVHGTTRSGAAERSGTAQ